MQNASKPEFLRQTYKLPLPLLLVGYFLLLLGALLILCALFNLAMKEMTLEDVLENLCAGLMGCTIWYVISPDVLCLPEKE